VRADSLDFVVSANNGDEICARLSDFIETGRAGDSAKTPKAEAEPNELNSQRCSFPRAKCFGQVAFTDCSDGLRAAVSKALGMTWNHNSEKTFRSNISPTYLSLRPDIEQQ